MKRPWHVWLILTLCLSVVFPAMGWLTVKALELDRNEAAARRTAEAARQEADAARRQAELQELIGKALYRMDWMLAPLIAQEAARPYFVYQAFYSSLAAKEAKIPAALTPSPLVVPPSEYVLVHFQLAPEDQWSSPQCPSEQLTTLACSYGASPESIQLGRQRLNTLRASVHYDQLLQLLPEKLLPPMNDQPSNFALEGGPGADASQLGFGGNGSTIDNRYTIPLPATGKPALPFQRDSQQDFDVPARRTMREDSEWMQRNKGLQSYANSQMAQQRAAVIKPDVSLAAREGVSRPLWISSKLLLARRVVVHDRTVIQGCWFDWPRIRDRLLAEVADLLPDCELRPVDSAVELQSGRALASLPAQLVVPPAAVAVADTFDREAAALSTADQSSVLELALVVAWGCLLLAVVAVAVLVRGAVALSERRGAFVSAVTHELRTPLTTFRMYTEMLAEGMIPEKGQQRSYLETLRTESDRLSHLVDNVLQYARLERGRAGRQRTNVGVGQLQERCVPRLVERTRQADMMLEVELDASTADAQVLTDPSAVEQIMFNLVDNACKYAAGAADRRIHVAWRALTRTIEVSVRDHGPGISAEQAKRLFRPFSKTADEAARTAPGVGLGLALCRRLAHDLGARLAAQPAQGAGAEFVLSLPRPLSQ